MLNGLNQNLILLRSFPEEPVNPDSNLNYSPKPILIYPVGQTSAQTTDIAGIVGIDDIPPVIRR